MRTLAKIIISVLLLASACHGQAIFRAQNVATGGGGGGSTVAFLNTNTMQRVGANSVTDSTHMSVTTGGANKIAFAVIAFDGSGAAISSVTYGGSTMTSCGSASHNTTSNGFTQCFWLANPPTGLNTLVISGNGSVSELFYNVTSYTGVNQTTPVRPSTYQTSTGNSAAPSLTITSDVNDLTMTVLVSTNTITSTNQTSDGIDNAGTQSGASDHATTAAASVTHTWTITSSQWAILGLSIQHN